MRSLKIRYVYVLLILCWVGFFYSTVNRNIQASVLPIVKDEFLLSYTEAGMIGAVLIFVHAALQLPSGYLADRFSKKKMMVACTLFYSVATFLTALLSSSFWQLVLFHGLMGIAGSFYYVPGQSLLVENFPPDKRGRAIGFWFTAHPASLIAAALVLLPLAERWGWRFPYYVSALSGFVLVLVLWRMIREPKKSSYVSFGIQQFGSILKNRTINIIAVIGLLNCVVLGLTNFLPTFFVEEYEIGLTLAGWLWVINPIVSIVGDNIGGSLCDKFEGRTVAITTTVFSAILLFTLFFLSKSLHSFLIIYALITIAQRATNTATTVTVLDFAQPGQIGKVLSYTNTIGVSGIAIGSLVIGLVIDNFGFSSSFIFLALNMLVAFVFALTMPEVSLEADM